MSPGGRRRAELARLPSGLLPDGLSLVDHLPSPQPDARCFFGQVQGRTYANIFGLVGAMDGLLVQQAGADTGDFVGAVGQSFSGEERERIAATFLRAYRYQYIVSGIRDRRFVEVLGGMVNAQLDRIHQALAPLLAQ